VYSFPGLINELVSVRIKISASISFRALMIREFLSLEEALGRFKFHVAILSGIAAPSVSCHTQRM